MPFSTGSSCGANTKVIESRSSSAQEMLITMEMAD